MLGKNLPAVNMNIKDPAATRNQLRFHIELGLNLGRQTGGLGKVISLAAVLDRYLHLSAPFRFL